MDAPLYLPNQFPNVPLFARLLSLLEEDPGREHNDGIGSIHSRPALVDGQLGKTTTLPELLREALRLREVIVAALKPETVQALKEDRDVFIGVCLPTGHDWFVAALAVQALGCAVVALSPYSQPEEIVQLLEISTAVAVVFESASAEPATSVGDILNKQHSGAVVLGVREVISTPAPVPLTITLSPVPLKPSGAAWVVFTSGTTGPPKGVVHHRRAFAETSPRTIKQLNVQPGDRILDILPRYWITGISTAIMFLLAGAEIDMPRSGAWIEEYMWNRIRKGEIHWYVGFTQSFAKLCAYYRDNIAKLSPEVRREYADGLARLKGPITGGSMLPASVCRDWNALPGSRPLLSTYGTTEVGAVAVSLVDSVAVQPNNLGSFGKDVTVKLSEGDQGELLLKCPNMFREYLHRPEETAAAFDADGFFRTGDQVRREGNRYIFEGRLNFDVFKFQCYKIVAHEVESAIQELGDVQDVLVIPVRDDTTGKVLVGAIIRPTTAEIGKTGSEFPTSLRSLRAALYANGLAAYKLPSALTIIDPRDPPLPRSPVGKILKAKAREKYFPDGFLQGAAPAVTCADDDDGGLDHESRYYVSVNQGAIQVYLGGEQSRSYLGMWSTSSKSGEEKKCYRLWDWAGL